jgi:pimeloyl-ACP methyl ester carboxylesterase
MLKVAERLALAGLWAVGFKSRFVDTTAGRVHVLDAAGSGALPPLVLLHGLGATAGDQGLLLVHLKARFSRVIALDLPGHGESADLSGRDADAFTRGTFEALDAVMTGPSVLFGNSLGGLVAIRYALQRPERVLGLFLASPGGAPMAVADLDRFRIDNGAQARAFVDIVLGRPRWGRGVLAWGVRRRFANPLVRVLLDAAVRSQLSPEDVRSLPMPVHVLWGAAERVLPPSHRQFFLDNLPDPTRFDAPEGLGHAPFLDDPAGVARRVVAFVAELPPHGSLAA